MKLPIPITGGMGKISQLVTSVVIAFLAVGVYSQNGVGDPDAEKTDKEMINVGLLGSLDYGIDRLIRRTGGALTIARNYINNKSDLLADYSLEFEFADTNNTELGSIKALTDLWRKDVVAYFGLDISCETEAHVASAWNLPMISFVSLISSVYYYNERDSYCINFNSQPKKI